MRKLAKAEVRSRIIFFLVVGSTLVSMWSVYADPIINIDGILYIRSAEAFFRNDIDSAISLYKWPFYPYLIHLVHGATGIDRILAAHLLNALFNILTCLVFVFLVRELGGDQRTLWIASAVIVLFPGLNELRSYIIRDHGYILFYLLALWFLLKALPTRSIPLLAVSLVFMGSATLFRIEGFVFLIAILLTYSYPVIGRALATGTGRIVLAAVLVVVLVPVFGWWFHAPDKGPSQAVFAIEDIGSGWNQAYEALQEKIDLLKTEVINTSSNSVARLVFLWTVVGIIFAQVLILLSIPYALLTGYGLKQGLVFPNALAMRPWWLFIYCNVGILVLFTLTWFFLTDRYPLALVVTLLMAVPFALTHVYERWRSMTEKTALVKAGYAVLALVLFINCAEGLTSFSDKHYLRESGHWLQANAPPGSRLFTNDPVIGFYSGFPDDKVTVIEDREGILAKFYRGKWIEYEYVALQVDPNPDLEFHLKKTLWVIPEKVFLNERKKEVRIYNIKKHRERKDQ